MILLNDIKNSLIKYSDKLKINETIHLRTWEFYYKQYDKAFCLLLDISKKRKYQTNYKFMPFMFLLWHSLELFLKLKCKNKGIPFEEYARSHVIKDLFAKSCIQDESFAESFKALQCESTGECWRYPFDKNGNLQFQDSNVVDAYAACRHYCFLTQGIDVLAKFENDKIYKNELTFHTNECQNMGLLVTQYDIAINDIIQAITKNDVSVNEIYLPLLFLIRHSLESNLKSSMLDMGNALDIKQKNLIHKSHSLHKLYNTIATFLNSAIEKLSDKALKDESITLRNKVISYIDEMHKLDANSYEFRFPFQKNQKLTDYVPSAKDIIRILQLYIDSNSYLCFAVEVLKNAGTLKVGDDVLDYLYN